jgi:hypothetical protein
MSSSIRRNARRRIGEAAIAAWKSCDFHGLHRALGLKPWERSPFQLEVTALGCDEDEFGELDEGDRWDESWLQAITLQRALLKLAGPPDRDAVLAVCEANIERTQEAVDYHTTGAVPADNPALGAAWSETNLADARARLARLQEQRKELLAEIRRERG